MTATRPVRDHDEVRLGPEDRLHLPPRRFPDAVRVLLAPVLMLLTAFAPFLLVLVPGFVDFTRGITDPVVGAAVTLPVHVLTALVAVLLVWLCMRLLDRRPMRETGLRFNARTIPMLLLGTAIATIIVLVVALPLAAAGLMRPPEPMDGPFWLAVLLGISAGFVLQAFPEEFVWRGYLLQTMRVRAEVAVLVSAVLFALMHLMSEGGQESPLEHLMYLAVPFGFAVLAGGLVLRTGSMWAAVGVHGGVHLGTLILTHFFDVGEGPAYWLIGGLVFTVVGLLVMRASRSARPAADHVTTR